MYSKSTREILLWAQSVDDREEANDSDESESHRKRPRLQEKEEELEKCFRELQNKHGSNYSIPQLRLWARMIQCGTHDDYDNPPHVPMISGVTPKQ